MNSEVNRILLPNLLNIPESIKNSSSYLSTIELGIPNVLFFPLVGRPSLLKM